MLSDTRKQDNFQDFFKFCDLSLNGPLINIDIDSSEFCRRLKLQIEQLSSAERLHLLSDTDVFFSDPDNLYLALQPICCCNLKVSKKESFIKLLLSTEALQNDIVQLLLDKIPDYFVYDVHHTLMQVPIMIFRQLRWLDHLQSSQEILDKLIGIISVSPNHLQHDMISFLPEIVGESLDIVAPLRLLLRESMSLIVPILDCLSTVSLDIAVVVRACTLDISLQEIRCLIFGHFPLLSADSIPVVLRFLFQTAQPEFSTHVIQKLRQHIHLDRLFPMSLDLANNQERSSVIDGHQESALDTILSDPPTNSFQSMTVLFLDTLRHGLKQQHQKQPFLYLAWLEELQNVSTKLRQMTSFDLLMCMLLYSSDAVHANVHSKTRIESIFRQCCIVPEHRLHFFSLLNRTFDAHAELMQPFAKEFLSMAEALVRVPSAHSAVLGEELYLLCFTHFTVYLQQDVIASLLTHLGSPSSLEINASLSVLRRLCCPQPPLLDKLMRFSAFLRATLDYVDHLSFEQQRALFEILGCMLDRDKKMYDDMMILLKKRLSSPQDKSKMTGLLGMMSIVHHLILDRRTVSAGNTSAVSVRETQEGSIDNESNEHVKKAWKLLQSTYEWIQTSPVMTGLFYREVSTSLDRYPHHLLTMIHEKMAMKFQDYFLDDYEDTVKDIETGVLSHSQLLYNLDGDDATVSVKLYAFEHPAYVSMLPRLCAHMELLSRCESLVRDNCLDGIDALFGCPLLLPTSLALPVFQHQLSTLDQEHYCLSLYYAINWMRQVMNAFAKCDDLTWKLMERLQHLLILEEKWCTYACFPSILQWMNQCGDQLDRLSVGFSSHVYRALFSTLSRDRLSYEPEKCRKIQYLLRSLGNASREQRDGTRLQRSKRSNTSSTVAEQEGKQQRSQGLLPVLNTFYRQCIRGNEVLKVDGIFPFLYDILDQIHLVLSKKRQSVDIFDYHADRPSTKDDTCLGAVYDQLLETFVLLKDSDVYPLALENRPFSVFGDTKEKAFRCILNWMDTTPSLASIKNLLSLSLHCMALTSSVDLYDRRDVSLIVSLKSSVTYLLDKNRTWNALKTAELKEYVCLLTEYDIRASVDPIACIEDSLSALEQSCATSTSIWYLSHETITVAMYRILFQELATVFLYVSGAPKRKSSRSRHEDLANDHDEKHGEGTDDALQTANSSSSSLSKMDDHAMDDRLLHAKSFEQYFVLLERIIPVFYRLVQFVKETKKSGADPLLLSTAMTFSHQLLNAFIRYAMPKLTIHFKTSYRDPILNLLRVLQQATRRLQMMCMHCKAVRDTQSTVKVPMVKKTLELLVFKVKAMLDANACSSAFWLGNLKHRNLNGEEVPSQVDVEADENMVIENDEQVEEDENELEKHSSTDDDEKRERFSSGRPRGTHRQKKSKCKDSEEPRVGNRKNKMRALMSFANETWKPHLSGGLAGEIPTSHDDIDDDDDDDDLEGSEEGGEISNEA